METDAKVFPEEPPKSGKAKQPPNLDKLSTSLDSKMSAEKGEEKVNRLEELRLRTKKFMTSSFFGRGYTQIMLILSILSCVEFIYQTYLNPNKPYMALQMYYFEFVEMGLSGLFACDWILAFFIADHKVAFFMSFYSMVDLLTVIPIWARFLVSSVPTYSSINSLTDAIVYTLYGLNTTRVLRALRIRKKLLLIEDAVDRCLGDMALTISVMILFNTAAMQYLEAETQPLQFHTWTYYIWVTIATVGYGDITPKSDLGRFAAMAMIGFAIIQVPKMTNELIEKMSMQSIYARAKYRPNNKHSTHVLICGDLKSTSLTDFFEELFHEDHSNEDIHAVILQPDPPSGEMLTIINDSLYSLSITYLQGSALVEKDLSRALTDSVKAVFIMTHKFSANPDEEDAKTILQQFSIRRYIQCRNPMNTAMFCMQLVRPENRRHLTSSGNQEGNDIVACMNEIKMGVIAKAVMAPGTSTMIMNLLSSFADDFDEDGDDESDAEVDQLENDDNGNWVDEYKKGCDWEIYTTKLSEIFVGWKFSSLSEYLYQKLGIVLFGLQIEDCKQSGKVYSRTLLNPGDFKIPPMGEMIIDAFVLAKNTAESDLTFSGGELDSSIAATGGGLVGNVPGQLASVPQLSFLRNNLHTDSRLNPRSGGRRGGGAVAQSSSSVSHESGQEGIEMFKVDDDLLDDDSGGPKKKTVYSWQTLLRKFGDSRPNAFTHQEAIQKAEDIHLKENYFVRGQPIELADAVIKTSVIEEVPILEKLCNHIIIMGKSLNNLYDLIRPLRARQLGSLRYIVILYAQDIPHAVWQRISIFEGILVVRGSSLEEADIRRAGIFQAQKVIVLADAEGEGGNPLSHGSASTKASSLEILVDADAIFSYQCVRRMNENAQVVVEIVKHSSIGYLDQELSSREIHYKFTPQFASGALFTSSLLDTIVCQAFYNPLIIKVINKLISGIEHKDYNEIAASAGTTQIKPKGLAAITGSSLYQINIPEDLESHTYGALYKHLAKVDMIPLGIFRGIFNQMKTGPKANKMSYVFTNPPKDTELFSCDKIFVLSQKPQFSDKKKEQLKEIQLIENLRKRRNLTEDTAETVTNIRSEVRGLHSRQDQLQRNVADLKKDLLSKLEELAQSLVRPESCMGESVHAPEIHVSKATLANTQASRLTSKSVKGGVI